MSIPAPQLVSTDGVFNVVLWNGLYWRVPIALGQIDVSNVAGREQADKANQITVHDTALKAQAPTLFNASALGHVVARGLQLTSKG
jgi:hypothetical protein